MPDISPNCAVYELILPDITVIVALINTITAMILAYRAKTAALAVEKPAAFMLLNQLLFP